MEVPTEGFISCDVTQGLISGTGSSKALSFERSKRGQSGLPPLRGLWERTTSGRTTAPSTQHTWRHPHSRGSERLKGPKVFNLVPDIPFWVRFSTVCWDSKTGHTQTQEKGILAFSHHEATKTHG